MIKSSKSFKYKPEVTIQEIKYHVIHGADPNMLTTTGIPAIHYVAQHFYLANAFEVAKILLEAGADLNIQKPYSNYTAIIYLFDRHEYFYTVPQYQRKKYSSTSPIKFIKLLLRYGVDLEVKTYIDYTVVESVCYHWYLLSKQRFLKVVKILIEAGANTEGLCDMIVPIRLHMYCSEFLDLLNLYGCKFTEKYINEILEDDNHKFIKKALIHGVIILMDDCITLKQIQILKKWNQTTRSLKYYIQKIKKVPSIPLLNINKYKREVREYNYMDG